MKIIPFLTLFVAAALQNLSLIQTKRESKMYYYSLYYRKHTLILRANYLTCNTRDKCDTLTVNLEIL